MESYDNTQLDKIFALIVADSEGLEVSEQIYQYSKVLKMENDLEISIFVNPSRKKKKWTLYMDSIGSNLKIIQDRFEEEHNLYANQVLLTGDYDDCTSDSDLPGYDIEAQRQAQSEKNKDCITTFIGQQIN